MGRRKQNTEIDNKEFIERFKHQSDQTKPEALKHKCFDAAFLCVLMPSCVFRFVFRRGLSDHCRRPRPTGAVACSRGHRSWGAVIRHLQGEGDTTPFAEGERDWRREP